MADAIANDIKETWIPPSIGNLHWDGKLTETLTSKYENVDWLSVLISGKSKYYILVFCISIVCHIYFILL